MACLERPRKVEGGLQEEAVAVFADPSEVEGFVVDVVGVRGGGGGGGQEEEEEEDEACGRRWRHRQKRYVETRRGVKGHVEGIRV